VIALADGYAVRSRTTSGGTVHQMGVDAFVVDDAGCALVHSAS
jgi:hypothetical protein